MSSGAALELGEASLLGEPATAFLGAKKIEQPAAEATGFSPKRPRLSVMSSVTQSRTVPQSDLAFFGHP
jgi:hypothetical protein